jgi:hypothetical protein
MSGLLQTEDPPDELRPPETEFERRAYVIFFGGYKATQVDMKVWVASAGAQRPSVEFTAFPQCRANLAWLET